MECGQPYSPVSDWIKQVDLVLEDEGQLWQHGGGCNNGTYSTHML